MTVPPVATARHLGGHTILIRFADGKENAIDFLPFLKRFAHPDYDCYLDEAVFAQFKVMDGNLDWNDCHMSFTPESLYRGEL